MKDSLQTITIIRQRAGGMEIPWIRFLLGDWAGDVVDDPDRRLVLPYSVMVCDRPAALKSKVLAQVRRHGTVGLLHVGDKRYRSRLDAYTSFGFVWRTHYHSALTDLQVRQLPVGPAAFDEVVVGPRPAALRRPAERLYTWAFIGRQEASHAPVLAAIRQIEGGYEMLGDGDGDGRLVDDAAARRDRASDLDILGDAVFVACPMSDQHIETARVYDALEVGAIPVVERRRRFDYFGALLGDHPLPTVTSWSEATGLLRDLLADHTALAHLHDRVVSWWTATKRGLARTAQHDVERCVSGVTVGSPLDDGPLNKPAPRWRGRVELLRHQAPRTRRRGQLRT